MTTDGARTRWGPVAARASPAVPVLCVLAVVLMHVEGGRTSLGVVLAGGLPVILLVAVVAALLPWRHRRWWRLALVASLPASQVSLLDHPVADGRQVPPDSPTITVATLNTAWAGPTDAELVDPAEGADVLALREWAPDRTDGPGPGARSAVAAGRQRPRRLHRRRCRRMGPRSPAGGRERAARRPTAGKRPAAALG
uniref:Uncharacterized protein n=1 Tax=Janibacter limosus TaxID=53458 RepID=A0AC61U316_9MICO|nr:hypothetical protein [Janibacter limosus]